MKDQTSLWIVGKALNQETTSWEFQCVFSSEEKAVAACVDDSYFVGPATLDNALSHDTTEWTGARYPRLETSDGHNQPKSRGVAPVDCRVPQPEKDAPKDF